MIVAVSLIAVSASSSASQTIDATFSTSDPIEIGGATETVSAGSLQLSWNDHAEVRLSADRIHVATTWERGQIVDSGELYHHRQIEDNGRDHHNFTDASLHVERWGKDAQLFSEPTGLEAEIGATSVGDTSIEVVPEGVTLARGGYSEQRVDVNRENVPSYVHRSEGPLVGHVPLEDARLQGSFRLFVHNVTLAIEHGAGESWENWTGFRESRTSSATSEYELRVTTLEVEGGRLAVANASNLSLLAPSFEADVEGSLATDSARGTVEAGGEEIRLGGRPLELSGSGDLVVLARGEPQAGLEAEVSGSFEVLSHDGVPSQDGERGLAAPVVSPWVVASVGLLGLVVLGAVAVRRPGLLRGLPPGVRDPLYRRWLEAGRAREDAQEFGAAAGFYRRLTALDPSDPTGWYHRSRALLDGGRAREALEVASEGRSRLAAPPLDLIELEVAAAVEASKRQTAREALLDLAEASPEMARGLAGDLGLEWVESDAEIQGVLGEDDEEPGGLQGYV